MIVELFIVRMNNCADIIYFHSLLGQMDLLRNGKVPVPHPAVFEDTWDDVHVKMPCSSSNLFPVENEVYFPSDF